MSPFRHVKSKHSLDVQPYSYPRFSNTSLPSSRRMGFLHFTGKNMSFRLKAVEAVSKNSDRCLIETCFIPVRGWAPKMTSMGLGHVVRKRFDEFWPEKAPKDPTKPTPEEIVDGVSRQVCQN